MVLSACWNDRVNAFLSDVSSGCIDGSFGVVVKGGKTPPPTGMSFIASPMDTVGGPQSPCLGGVVQYWVLEASFGEF